MNDLSQPSHTPEDGDLRVWWIPQVPMQPFITPVRDVASGAMLLEVLARYDLFQLDNNIKPDYCNAGGLDRFEDGEWCSWYDESTGEDNPAVYVALATQTPEAGSRDA